MPKEWLNDLHKKLEDAEDAKAADKILSKAYKTLKKVDGFQALQLLFYNLKKQVEARALSDERITGDQRCYFAGYLGAVKFIEQAIKAGVDFDPSKATYEEPPKEAEITQMPEQEPDYY